MATSLQDIARRGGGLNTATTFSGEYSTSGLMFPADLMSENNPYGGNYVVFYVNVHEDSVLAKDGSTSFIDAANVTPRQRGDQAGVSAGGVATAVGVTGVAAANAAGVAQKAAGAAGADLKKNAAVLGNTVIGAAATGAAIATLGGAKKEYKRQQKAIALYVPGDVSIKYGVSWEAEDMAGVAAIAAGAENLGKAISLNPKSIVEGVGGAVGAGASYLTSKALNTPGGAGAMLSKSTGIAANPKKEQLFKQVDYRTFSFSYDFFPRNSGEARNVQEIIKQFKLHMHPEYKDANHFLYIFPSEFDIFYYQNGRENMNLHRHTSCVLTDLNISYAPQGVFTTFDDGMPTQIKLQLTFKELALLSKETVLDGF